MSRRLTKEDEKLKLAIGQHYKKLCILERSKFTDFHFSDHVHDLMLVLGYKQSE